MPLVAWVCALLALLAASFIHTSRSAALLAHQRAERAGAQAAADAGVAIALLGVLGVAPDGTWPQDGRRMVRHFGRESVTIAVQDELGLIDVNVATADTIAQLFRNVGTSREASLAAARAITLWRNGHRLSEVEQLAQVPGVPSDLVARVAPYLTTRTGTEAVDPVTAPSLVLASLPGLAASTVATLVITRAVATVLPGTLPLLNDVSLQGVPLHHYDRIRVDAQTGAGVLFRREVEVELHPDAAHAYHVLTWRQSAIPAGADDGR